MKGAGMDRPLAGRRIAFVLPSLGMGGAERQASLLATHLADVEGARVEVLSLGPPVPVAEWFTAPALRAERFRLLHSGGARALQAADLARFVLLLRRRRVEVLLPYCMFPNVFAGLAARGGGHPVCLWSQRDEGRLRVEPWVERLALKGVSGFVSNSRHGADFLTRVLGVDPARVHLVHNGIEVPSRQAPSGGWRARLGLDERAWLACMVANLHRFKDHETLIAAWRLVVDHSALAGLDPHLLLAGAFVDRYEARLRQVRELGLTGHVHFCGVVTDVPGLLAECSLAVFSSRAEGLPNAVLEAMAAGLPVAATDYPGIREALGEQAADLLAPAADPAALADRILRAIRDRGLCERLGHAGRERVQAEFSVDAMRRRTTDIIRGLLPPV